MKRPAPPRRPSMTRRETPEARTHERRTVRLAAPAPPRYARHRERKPCMKLILTETTPAAPIVIRRARRFAVHAAAWLIAAAAIPGGALTAHGAPAPPAARWT